MVEISTFQEVIEFMGELGVYDIILPFLLVFTIVFAILEKTKILGVEKINGKDFTKKNLNSVVAFVMAFLVIASTQLVAVINEVLANVVLLLILAVSFLLLVGIFFTDKEFSLEKMPGWVSFFMIFMFVGVIIIFLNALGWLEAAFNLISSLNAEWLTTLIFILIIFAAIGYVVYDPKRKKTAEESKEK